MYVHTVTIRIVLLAHLPTEGFELGKDEFHLRKKQIRTALVTTATTVRTKNAMININHINPVLRENDPSDSAISVWH